MAASGDEVKAGWIDAGGAAPLLFRVLLGILLVLAPFAFGAVIRVVTGLPMPLTPFAGAAVVAGGIYLLRRFGIRMPRVVSTDRIPALVVAALIIGLSVYCLANRYVWGLSNYRGTDGSSHAHILDEFAYHLHHTYGDCIIFHALAYWFQTLTRLNRFWAFVFGFYTEVVIVALVTATLAMHAVAAIEPARRRRLTLAFVALALVAVSMTTTLPLQHLNQTDGFFAHLFALIPLFLLWLGDAWLLDIRARAAVLLALTVLTRYVYALNLADLLVTLAIFAVIEGVRRVRFRRSAWMLAVVLVAGGALVFKEVWTWHTMVGHYVQFEWKNAAIGQGLAIVLLGTIAIASPEGSRLRRLARFPALLGLVNFPLTALIRFLPKEGFYYGAKYPFHATMLLASAVAIMVPVVVADAFAQASWRRRVSALVATAAALAMIVTCYRGYEPYQKGFIERAFKKPPYTENLPLADLTAWRLIQRTVKREQKHFGGYLVSHFGMMMFMNASLAHPHFGWPVWFGQALEDEPGNCVFWDEGPAKDWPVWEAWFPQRKQRDALKAMPETDKTCSVYAPSWNPKGPKRRLCHHCQ